MKRALPYLVPLTLLSTLGLMATTEVVVRNNEEYFLDARKKWGARREGMEKLDSFDRVKLTPEEKSEYRKVRIVSNIIDFVTAGAYVRKFNREWEQGRVERIAQHKRRKAESEYHNRVISGQEDWHASKEEKEKAIARIMEEQEEQCQQEREGLFGVKPDQAASPLEPKVVGSLFVDALARGLVSHFLSYLSFCDFSDWQQGEVTASSKKTGLFFASGESAKTEQGPSVHNQPEDSAVGPLVVCDL